MHTVVEMPAYLSAAKSARMTEIERNHVVDVVSADLEIGVVVERTGGCRKLRVAGRGKGKSGGYRVITLFGGAICRCFC